MGVCAHIHSHIDILLCALFSGYLIYFISHIYSIAVSSEFEVHAPQTYVRQDAAFGVSGIYVCTKLGMKWQRL